MTEESDIVGKMNAERIAEIRSTCKAHQDQMSDQQKEMTELLMRLVRQEGHEEGRNRRATDKMQGKNGHESMAWGKVVAVGVAVGSLTLSTFGLLQQQLNHTNNRISEIELHSKELGHPHVQTEAVNHLQDELTRVETRSQKQLENLASHVAVELEKVASISDLLEKRNQARLVKLEEWQNTWYQTGPAESEAQKERIASIGREVNRIRELFKTYNPTVRLLVVDEMGKADTKVEVAE